jgi:TRAP-type C4-dicarboxylate transport system permease small subunit
MKALLAHTDAVTGLILRVISGLCLTGLFLLVLVNVAARTFSFAGFAWFDEIVQGLFAWMVFVGAAALWRERQHFRVDWLELALGAGRSRAALSLLLTLLSLAFLIAMTLYGYDLTARSRALTPILGLPSGLFYAAIPLSGGVMTLYSLRDLWIALLHLRSSKESI